MSIVKLGIADRKQHQKLANLQIFCSAMKTILQAFVLLTILSKNISAFPVISMSNSYVNLIPVLADFSNCTVHFEQYVLIFDYSGMLSPYVISKPMRNPRPTTRPWQPRTTKSPTTTTTTPTTPTKPRVENGSLFPYNNTRNVKCQVVAFLSDVKNPIHQYKSKYFADKSTSDTLKMQYIARPNYYLVVSNTIDMLNAILIPIFGFLFGIQPMDHLPLIFGLQYDTQPQYSSLQIQISSGCFVCWYCGPEISFNLQGGNIQLQYFEFVKKQSSSIRDVMMETVANNTQNGTMMSWVRLDKDLQIEGIYEPATGQRSVQSPSAFEFYRVENEVLGDFAWWRLHISYATNARIHPTFRRIHSEELRSFVGKNYELLPISSTEGKLYYIVMNNVTCAWDSYNIFSDPFESVLWIGVLIAVVVYAALAAAVASSNLNAENNSRISTLLVTLMRAFATSLFMLLDQADTNILKGVQSTRVVNALRRFAIAWAMFTIIITNGYKGSLKSGFLVASSCTSTYKSVQDLLSEDYDLLVPFSSSWFRKLVDTFGRRYDLGGEENSVLLPKKSCDVFDYILRNVRVELPPCRILKGTANQIRWSNETNYDSTKIKLINNKATIMHDWISQNHGRRFAFIVRDYDFVYYWNMFRGLMRQNESWRFATDYTEKARNSYEAYVYTGGVIPEHRNGFVKGLKSFTATGVINHMEWLNKVKFSHSGVRFGQSKAGENLKPLALTMGTPAVRIIFLLAGYFVALGYVTLALELFIYHANNCFQRYFR